MSKKMRISYIGIVTDDDRSTGWTFVRTPEFPPDADHGWTIEELRQISEDWHSGNLSPAVVAALIEEDAK